MICTSINHYRSNLKITEFDDSFDVKASIKDINLERELNYHELLIMVQKLSPACRMVFNLHVVDGYSHDDISKMLAIDIATSKSILSSARIKLTNQMVIF